MLNPPAQNPNDPFGVNQPSPFQQNQAQAPQPQDSNQPSPIPQQQFVTSLPMEPDQEKLVISDLNQLKKDWVSGAKQKKETMRRCISYSKNKLVDNDLLPLPSTNGSENDVNNDRPKIFMPVTRQNLKTIKAQNKSSIFPNDEDYFRIRSKTAPGMVLEDEQTEGFKYVLKQSGISQKFDAALWNSTTTGFFCVKPKIKQDKVTEWKIVPTIDEFGGESIGYQQSEITMDPQPDIDILNPLNFYCDPMENDSKRSKWFYVDRVKVRELTDENIFINKDRLMDYASTQTQSSESDSYYTLNNENGLSNNNRDIEKSIDYTEYYFPYVKIGDEEYRNWIFGIAGNAVLVRNHPNTLPKGINPAVFGGWTFEQNNPYGQGPAEDMMTLQKIINIMENFKIEDMARNANQKVINEDVDTSALHPVAGGYFIAPPGMRAADAVSNLGYDASLANELTNCVGIYTAQAQLVAGSQASFQGASNIDFKKTATEMQIYESVNQTIANDNAKTQSKYVEDALNIIMYLVAETYTTPVQVPIEQPGMPRQYVEVNFEPLKTGNFVIEMTGVNPSQSKQAQAQSIQQLLEMFINAPPEAFETAKPWIRQWALLQGIKDIDTLLDQTQAQLDAIQQQQFAEASAQAAMQSGVAGASPPMANG